MASLFINRRHASHWLRDLAHRLEALLMGSLWWLSARLSPARASALGRRLFSTLGPRTPKHRWVLANLRVAFPQHADAEIQDLGRQVWGHFGAWLMEYPHLDSIADHGMEIIHPDGEPAWLRDAGPKIFVGPHLANIELTGLAVKALGVVTDAVYSPLANSYLDRRLQAWRAIHQNHFIPKQNALRILIRNLRAGRSVGLVVDVRTDDAPLSRFFGVPAPTTEVPAWLARKFGYPIIPMAVVRVADARFQVVFYPPLETPDTDDDARAVAELSTAMNQAMASMISAHPGQWWCGKRRWPRAAYQGASEPRQA